MNQHFRTLTGWLKRLPRPLAALVAAALFIVCATLDKFTGTALSIALLYLAPIALAAWRVGRRSGLAFAIASAILQGLFNPSILHPQAGSLIALWNILILCGLYAVFALVVSEVSRLIEKERALARTDFLTGVRNRMAFLNEVDQEILRAVRHGQPLSLIFVDLDDFKSVNDRLGHREGDRLLAAVGQTLMQTIRGIDTVARLGGDEFVILLPNADAEAAAIVAPRIRLALLARMKQDLWPVTFSIGVLTCPIPPGSAEQLIHRADELMYRAKQQGKDRLVFSVQSA